MAVIRPMDFDDITRAVELEQESFPVPWNENGFFSYLIRDDSLFLVAEEEDGTVSGYCGCIVAADQADITNVCVARDFRRRGTGKQIVRTLMDLLNERGVNEVFLEVRQSNTAAQALYKGLGFEEVGIRKNYYIKPREHAIVMKAETAAE